MMDMKKGGINQYDFNVAFNISDRVYLGLTIGAYDVNYSKISTYGEEYGEYIVENVNYGTPSYEMTTENKIDGSGVVLSLELSCVHLKTLHSVLVFLFILLHFII